MRVAIFLKILTEDIVSPIFMHFLTKPLEVTGLLYQIAEKGL